MLELELGRRYERLLFASAPLSVVALFVLLVAVATANQKGHATATCFERLSAAVENGGAPLNKAWIVSQPVTKAPYWGAEYRYRISMALIEASAGHECYSILRPEIDNRYRDSPEVFVQKLRAEAAEIRKQPLNAYGVEIPDKASIDVFGTTIKAELAVLTRAFQIVLAPLLALWLGSIYNTRFRESLRISAAHSVEAIFPHLVNVYPVGRFAELRKKSWLAYYWPTVIALIYAFIRITLLMVFVAPPVAAYLTSLYLIRLGDFEIMFFILGVIVCIFAMATCLIELYPWHLFKVFRTKDPRTH